MNFDKYNKDLSYSYIFGAFGTIELLNTHPEKCLGVLVDPSFISNDSFKKIKTICENNKISLTIDLKSISKIRDKGNIFVVGVFEKFTTKINDNKHLILSNVNDLGTIGTVIRSMAGFGFKSLVLVNCHIDLFDDHLVRSTMGAFFKTNIEIFDTMEDYKKKFNSQKVFYISNKGNSINTIDSSDDISIVFSGTNEFSNERNTLSFCEDIPLENKVNIVLFSIYN